MRLMQKWFWNTDFIRWVRMWRTISKVINLNKINCDFWWNLLIFRAYSNFRYIQVYLDKSLVLQYLTSHNWPWPKIYVLEKTLTLGDLDFEWQPWPWGDGLDYQLDFANACHPSHQYLSPPLHLTKVDVILSLLPKTCSIALDTWLCNLQ